jgi:hypothetical protein
VSLFRQAQGDLRLAAACLASYRRGEETPQAEVGALLEAEQIALIRSFLTKK